MIIKTLSRGIFAGFLALSMTAVMAQSFPNKPVKIVVPYPPGGANDIVARLVAQKLTEQMGQTFLVENKPGASGNNGANEVAKGAADGYTMLLVTTGHSIAPALNKLPYDITSDLAPVTTLISGPMLVLTNPQGNIKTMADLIVAGKAKPGQLNYGSAGVGSTTHLAAELIASTAGVKFNHIPYKGSAPAMADVMGGHAEMVMDLMLSSVPHVQAGKLRAIAITSAKRAPSLPDVPTLSESGFSGMEMSVWNGLMVPSKTPKAVISKLNEEILKAMSSPDLKARIKEQGFDVLVGSPEQFTVLLKSEMARWAVAVKASGAASN
jgi:tripartite-type tricarboxylate transporter receptor subunit TctC